jgi:uncharacterized membrane protein
MDADAHRVRSRHRQAWIHAVWTLLIAGAATATLLSVALSKTPPGQCEGIGWGCSLHGGDAALFVAIFVVPIALVMLILGNAIIAVVAWLLRRRARHAARE